MRRRACGDGTLVEERRLLYVAITRAEDTLLISGHHWGATGIKPSGPSDFLVELKDIIDQSAATGEVCGVIERWASAPADGDRNPLRDSVHEALWPVDPTDGRGADVVVEVVGIAAATVEGLDMVRFNGKFVDIGNIVPQPVSFPATKVITQQIHWTGLMHYNPWIMPAALDFLVRTKDKYPLSKVVSHSFPLSEVNRAFEFAEWQGKGAGSAATRVILKP